jgi:hypothetical protein
LVTAHGTEGNAVDHGAYRGKLNGMLKYFGQTGQTYDISGTNYRT